MFVAYKQSSMFRLPKLFVQQNLCALSITQRYCSVKTSPSSNKEKEQLFKTKLATGPGFQDFIKDVSANVKSNNNVKYESDHIHAYLPEDTASGDSRKGRSILELFF